LLSISAGLIGVPLARLIFKILSLADYSYCFYLIS